MGTKKLKAAARIKFKNIRKSSIIKNQKLILLQVNDFLENFVSNKESKSLIGLYWPLEGEVDLRSLKENRFLSLALPACNKKGDLTYHQWTEKPLIKDSFGIPAPLSEPSLNPCEIKLLMVPALAIDHRGIRLGYGGGSFDRLRKKLSWKAIQALAIVPMSCITDYFLPKDPWDIPFDGWINEKETYHINVKE